MNSRWIKGFACVLAVFGVALLGACGKAQFQVSPAEKAVTLDNLKTAYLAESVAQARYAAYAAKADEEGYKSVAVLFRAAVASQDVLIKKRAALVVKMGGAALVPPDAKPPEVRTTRENLQAALAADIGAKNMRYMVFARQAKAVKNDGAMYSFKGAVASESEYVKFFKLAMADLDGWKAEGKTFAVCTVCSFPILGAPPATCPVCQSPREKFTVIK